MAKFLISNSFNNKIYSPLYQFVRFKKPARKDNYIITRATHQDFDEILLLMDKYYYSEEPTTVALGITPNRCFEEKTLRMLQGGMSVVCKCKFTGCIVGTCINDSTNPWDPDLKDRLACTMSDKRLRSWLHFNAHIQRIPNLWKCYDVPKIFEVVHVILQPAEFGKGLTSRMIRSSRDLAADLGYTVMRLSATNFYVAQTCESLKLKLVAEIPYCTYIGENMEPIFKTPSPHLSTKVYVDDSPQSK